MSFLPATLGDRIRRLRLDLGLSQKELGQKVGVHMNQVHAWETGRYVPGLRTRRPLAEALRMAPEVLYYDGEEREAIMAEIAANVRVRVAHDPKASPTQHLSSAKAMAPKSDKDDSDAARELAQFKQRMADAQTRFRDLVAEIEARRSRDKTA